MARCDELEEKQNKARECRVALNKSALHSLTSASNANDFSKSWRRVRDAFDFLYDTPETINDLRQAILQLAVMGKLSTPNPKDKPVKDLLMRAVDEKIRLGESWNYREKKNKNEYAPPPLLLPDHWALTQVRDFSWVKGGKRIPKGKVFSERKTEHIYIRVTDMKNETISLGDLKYIDDDLHNTLARYIIEKDDVFVVIVGATIGKVGVVPESLHKAHLTENAAKLVFREIDRNFVLLCLQSQYIQGQFIDKTNQQAQPKLALERIESTYIPIPPIEEQLRVVTKVNDLMTVCDQLEEKNSLVLSHSNHLLNSIVDKILES